MAKRESKQDKLDRKAAAQIISGLNDLLSLINDVSNETGYDIPNEHHSNLMALHKELMDKLTGE